MSETKNKKGLMLIGGLGVALLVLMMVFSSGKPTQEPKDAGATNQGAVNEKELNFSAEQLVTENEKLQAEIANVQHQLEELKAVDANSLDTADSQKESVAR